VSCATNSTDPRRGADGGTKPWLLGAYPEHQDVEHKIWGKPDVAPPDPNPPEGAWKDNLTYKELDRAADEAWQRYYEAAIHYAEVITGAAAGDRDSAWKAQEEARTKANEAINKRNAWRPKVADNDDGQGGDDTTGVAHVSPLAAGDLCQDLAQQLAECARDGWRTRDCQQLKSALDGCATRDQGVIDPLQDEADDPGPCAQRGLTATEAETVTLACESRVRYGPEGGSPCTGFTLASSGAPEPVNWFCLSGGSAEGPSRTLPTAGETRCYVGGANPCGGPETQPDPDHPAEGCQGHATLSELQPALASVLAIAFWRLGGPAWTPPGTGSPLPGGGPDPAPAGEDGRAR
jgi:hypothetical protein